jgi:glycerate kinase
VPSRILIACDKFKGSLSAPEACAAIASGLRRSFPTACLDERPIADGGEGFAAALQAPLNGRWVETAAHDALGRPIIARWLLGETTEGTLAVIEMAEASGMWRIAANERDLPSSGTFGTGELMRHAIERHGVSRMVIGLGGSATNDGGAGMAAALGVRFLDVAGRELAPHPAALSGRLARIDFSQCIALPPVTAACDVENPLLGPAGATRVFGPQKGADAANMELLEGVLGELVRLSGGESNALLPGAGAAGGLGFGLLQFAAARLTPGFELLASLTGLEDAVKQADWVITGEGSLDAQSLSGKGPVALARLARRHGKRVIAICGKADASARDSGIFDSVIALADSGLPQETLLGRAADLLEKTAAGITSAGCP